MGTKKHKQKIWNMIKDIKIGMLNYQSGETIKSKPLQLIQDEYDNKLWFIVDKDSGIFQTLNESKSAVSVSFSDVENNTYVSLNGNGYTVDSKSLKDGFWNEYISAWFSSKEDAGLIEIKVEHGEHWDTMATETSFSKEIKKSINSEVTPNVTNHGIF